MKFSLLTIILFCGVFIISGKKVTKCLSYLPNSIPSGVVVDNATNKVTFPETTQDPTAQSKIKTKYDTKGLDAFFNLAKSFMNTVQKKDFPDMKGTSYRNSAIRHNVEYFTVYYDKHCLGQFYNVWDLLTY